MLQFRQVATARSLAFFDNDSLPQCTQAFRFGSRERRLFWTIWV